MMRRTAFRALGTTFGATVIPPIVNEACDSFEPGSTARANLEATVAALRGSARLSPLECPVVIDGVRYAPKNGRFEHRLPSEHQLVLANGYNATPELARRAIASSLAAFESWSRTPFQHRAAVLLKAATLISTKHRALVQATTMLGQAKNARQTEIDAVAETCDFLRFNVKFAAHLYSGEAGAEQPLSPAAANMWNMVEYRPLEGFIASITPFNFTAIGANLATAPVLMGNTVIWKPSPTQLASAYNILEILEEAGLPPGVINFLPCEPDVMSREVIAHESLAGVAFTGSTSVFTSINQNVAQHLGRYRCYPRVSGETGGKNFHLVHPSADPDTVVAQTLRGAFEYQGQKCSAASRLFVPKSMWPAMKHKLISGAKELKLGQPDDFATFVSAVIDEKAFNKITGFIAKAVAEPTSKLLAGGGSDRSLGWFVEPTIIETTDPRNCVTMREEIFGPVLTVFVYDDTQATKGGAGFNCGWGPEILDIVNSGTPYGLTGSIFARDRHALAVASDRLRFAAGNLYINDKSTGAVVGQQPFGGGRMSGTNDKPGAPQFLQRWVSPRTIKESFEPLPHVSYAHQLPHNQVIS